MRRLPVCLASFATGVLALTACGTPNTAGPEAAPAAAPIAALDPKPCSDELPLQASIAPGSIGLTASSWPQGSKMAEIRSAKKNKLVVGVSGDALLWGFSDPTKKGQLAGFDVDVAKAVADELKVPVEYRVLPLSGRLAALKAGTVDLVAERLSMTCGRWEGTATDPTHINMSSQYYTAGQRLLVRRDATGVNSIGDLKNKPEAERTVCAVAGSTSLTNAQAVAAANNLKLVVAADSGQCLVKFQEGEAAAITADDTTLAGFAAQDPNARVVGDTFGAEQAYALGTAAGTDAASIKKADDFTRYVNAVLEKLRGDGSLRRLYGDWMARNVAGNVAEPAVPAALYGRDTGKLERAS